MVIQEGLKFTAAPYTEGIIFICFRAVAVFGCFHGRSLSSFAHFSRACGGFSPAVQKPEAFRRNRKGAEACTIRALSRDGRESPDGDLRGFACEGRHTGGAMTHRKHKPGASGSAQRFVPSAGGKRKNTKFLRDPGKARGPSSPPAPSYPPG